MAKVNTKQLTGAVDVANGGTGATTAAGARTALGAVGVGDINKGIKDPVRFTTTGNIALSGLGAQAGGDWSGALTSDDRILVKNQSVGADNGWYAAAAGAWVRTNDANTTGQLVAGVLCTVSEGSTLADSLWMLTTDGTITIGTTALAFARQGASGQSAGEVCYFARNTAPTGFLKANGALVSRTTYAALFTAIGTTFGVGDGSTTFNLPELRGEFIRGWDDARGVDSGRSFGTTQTDNFKSHTHGTSTGAVTASAGANYPIPNAGGTGILSSATGGTETRPRNVALLACIKF